MLTLELYVCMYGLLASLEPHVNLFLCFMDSYYLECWYFSYGPGCWTECCVMKSIQLFEAFMALNDGHFVSNILSSCIWHDYMYLYVLKQSVGVVYWKLSSFLSVRALNDRQLVSYIIALYHCAGDVYWKLFSPKHGIE